MWGASPSKARKAALSGCFCAMDHANTGQVAVHELGIAMRELLGLSAAQAHGVLSRALPDEDGKLSPAEFSRLILEAEGLADEQRTFEAPGSDWTRGQLDAAPLGILMSSHRIRALVDSYMHETEQH